jgi:GNAT superfamily N-acetyltransferase
MQIARLTTLLGEKADEAALRHGMDAVFFETASRTFPDDAARLAFHELWLGQYLRHEPQHAWVALDEAGAVTGYLAGSLTDPATSPRFASLPYVPAFAPVSAHFPAHLHINLTASARGAGLGARLIDAFISDVAAAGLPGVHVVTGATARNVTFYLRQRFTERARTIWNDKPIVLLGRAIG